MDFYLIFGRNATNYTMQEKKEHYFQAATALLAGRAAISFVLAIWPL
jgi:hypothetical protein